MSVAPLTVALIVITVPVAAVIAFALYVARRRRDFLRARAQAAYQLGWVPAPPNPWLAEIAGTVFQRGTSNGQTTTTSTHQCHVVALNLPVALPPLMLTKDSKLARMLGRDLELESKAFNDAFRIGCTDNRYASAVLHPRMMEWMLHNPGLEWQFAGNALVSWGTGYWTVPDILARLEAMNGVIELVPSFVLRDDGRPVH